MRPAALAVACLLALSAAVVRADDEEDPEAPATPSHSSTTDSQGTAIGAGSKARAEGGFHALTVKDKKTNANPSGGGSGGGGGVASVLSPISGQTTADHGNNPPAAPPEKCEEPGCFRKAKAGVVEPYGAHREYNAVVLGESCHSSAKIFLLWELWHCRRMNRVADNANGCPNVPPSEQAKVLTVQSAVCNGLNKMQALEAQGLDANCDPIVDIYKDTLAMGERALFYKGRFMNRCKPQWDVPGHADPWVQQTKCSAKDNPDAKPGQVCTPPLDLGVH